MVVGVLKDSGQTESRAKVGQSHDGAAKRPNQGPIERLHRHGRGGEAAPKPAQRTPSHLWVCRLRRQSGRACTKATASS